MALAEVRQRWFNRYRVWKPLGLMTVAALTPGDWEITILDENQGISDYATMPRPDLVGIRRSPECACIADSRSRAVFVASAPATTWTERAISRRQLKIDWATVDRKEFHSEPAELTPTCSIILRRVVQWTGIYTVRDYAAITDDLLKTWRVAERRVSGKGSAPKSPCANSRGSMRAW